MVNGPVIGRILTTNCLVDRDDKIGFAIIGGKVLALRHRFHSLNRTGRMVVHVQNYGRFLCFLYFFAA